MLMKSTSVNLLRQKKSEQIIRAHCKRPPAGSTKRYSDDVVVINNRVVRSAHNQFPALMGKSRRAGRRQSGEAVAESLSRASRAKRRPGAIALTTLWAGCAR